uniref:Uncharacterized protein n=1 Tax=Anopheles atroparvus TaxID=41427 RepID=A0A182JN58_ANOAO
MDRAGYTPPNIEDPGGKGKPLHRATDIIAARGERALYGANEHGAVVFVFHDEVQGCWLAGDGTSSRWSAGNAGEDNLHIYRVSMSTVSNVAGLAGDCLAFFCTVVIASLATITVSAVMTVEGGKDMDSTEENSSTPNKARFAFLEGRVFRHRWSGSFGPLRKGTIRNPEGGWFQGATFLEKAQGADYSFTVDYPVESCQASGFCRSSNAWYTDTVEQRLFQQSVIRLEVK